MQELLKYLEYSKSLVINPFGLGTASCNNACSFCIVSERMCKGDVPLEYFKLTTQYTFDWLIKYKDILPADIEITFFFVAGELYYMNNEYFQLYKNTIQKLYDITKDKWKNIKFNIQSNLLHHNIQQIADLIDFTYTYCNIQPLFTTSFDLYGRFANMNTLNLWKNNINILSELIPSKIMIEMILTNPALILYNTQINELTETLDYILVNTDKFNISFEDFILNNPKNSNLYPQTENLIQFYTKIKEKYPNHSVLQPYYRKNIIKAKNNIPQAECILIQFTPDTINDVNAYTDNDHRIINKNCLGGMMSNLSKYDRKAIFKTIPEQKGLFCMNAQQAVTTYFNTKLGCSYCKYKPYCTHKCFAQYLPLAKSDICQTKALFKLFDTEI